MKCRAKLSPFTKEMQILITNSTKELVTLIKVLLI